MFSLKLQNQYNSGEKHNRNKTADSTLVVLPTANQKKKSVFSLLNTQKANQYNYTRQSSSAVSSPLSGLSSAAAAAAAAATSGSRAALFKLVNVLLNASGKRQTVFNNKNNNAAAQSSILTSSSLVSSETTNYKLKNPTFKMGNLENLIRLVYYFFK